MKTSLLRAGIAAAMLSTVCPYARAACDGGNVPAVRIIYEANLSDGMGFTGDVRDMERAVGGDLGTTKLVLIRAGDAQRLTKHGHRPQLVTTARPSLEMVRVPTRSVVIYNGTLIARFSEIDKVGTRTRSESGPTLRADEVRGLVRPLPGTPSTPPKQRQIAGYQCRVETVQRMGNQTVKQCVGRVGGFAVALSSSWPSMMEGGETQWFRATRIEAPACVSAGRFEPPDWVKVR